VSNFNNGDFYIDNVNGDFYLRKNNAWVLEGNIRGSGASSSDPASPIITGSGPPPDRRPSRRFTLLLDKALHT
jgi:hypothetical protein